MPTERRKHERTLCYLDVTEQATGKLIGNVNNIHQEGIMLISKTPIPMMKDIPVCLEIPQCGTGLPLVINGIWNRINSGPDYYTTGCRIIDPAPECIDAIRKFNDVLKKGAASTISFVHGFATS